MKARVRPLELCAGVGGFSLAARRPKAPGNATVPQVAPRIFLATGRSERPHRDGARRPGTPR